MITQERKLVLQVSNLAVELAGTLIFEKISFELRAGETLVILGPNGAGKTVLLRTLLGLLPYQGEISWSPGIKMGYVPQRLTFTRDLPITIQDFFALKGVPERDVPGALEQVGLLGKDLPRKQVGLLSSGQFQRVLIAWALVTKPDALLFDEPTSGIDVGGETAIQELLRRAQKERNIAVVLVTHDLTTVYSEATHVLCMNGRKFCYGSPEEILDPEVLKSIYGKEIKFFRHAHA